jgi:hypothetical protein
MTKEIVLIRCLFPWNILISGLQNDAPPCVLMLSYRLTR